jgi:hypothetical protein
MNDLRIKTMLKKKQNYRLMKAFYIYKEIFVDAYELGFHVFVVYNIHMLKFLKKMSVLWKDMESTLKPSNPVCNM